MFTATIQAATCAMAQCFLAVQASKGRPTLVRLLLESGAPVDVKDCLGATPLHRQDVHSVLPFRLSCIPSH